MTGTGAAHVAPSPWNAKQRLLLCALLAVGVIGLGAGYTGTSGTLRVSDQVVWVNIGGAALLVSGFGIALFLAAGRREIGRRRLGLFGDVLEGDGVSAIVVDGLSGDELLSAPTMTKYHRADCPFIEGKTVTAAPAEAHQSAGRLPCGVCLGGDEP